MILIVSDLFHAKLWNIHQLCVLQVLIEKGEKTSRKEAKKNGKCSSLSRHNFKQAERTMSQLATICRNKVQDKLQAEIESLSRQRVLCCDIAKEE